MAFCNNNLYSYSGSKLTLKFSISYENNKDVKIAGIFDSCLSLVRSRLHVSVYFISMTQI